jgi:hypothetical protein
MTSTLSMLTFVVVVVVVVVVVLIISYRSQVFTSQLLCPGEATVSGCVYYF